MLIQNIIPAIRGSSFSHPHFAKGNISRQMRYVQMIHQILFWSQKFNFYFLWYADKFRFKKLQFKKKHIGRNPRLDHERNLADIVDTLGDSSQTLGKCYLRWEIVKLLGRHWADIGQTFGLLIQDRTFQFSHARQNFSDISCNIRLFCILM